MCSEFFIECEPYQLTKIIYSNASPGEYADLVYSYKRSNLLIHSFTNVKTKSNKVSIMYKKVFKNQKACDSFVTDYLSLHKYQNSRDYFKILKLNKIRFTYTEKSLFDRQSIYKQIKKPVLEFL